jgi:hypothetical protein
MFLVLSVCFSLHIIEELQREYLGKIVTTVIIVPTICKKIDRKNPSGSCEIIIELFFDFRNKAHIYMPEINFLVILKKKQWTQC